MEIVLALLRTLVFVVATVALTVYVGRRIGRGRPLLWVGTTLLALYWLVLFGWTSYLTGNASPSPDLAIWVGWGGHLLPFFAALAYIWSIGQSAGFPARSGAGAGAALGKRGHQSDPSSQPAAERPNNPERAPETAVADSPGTGRATTPPTGSSPAAGTKKTAQPFPAPHAVPVVMTPPSGSSATPSDAQPGSTTEDSDRS